jgi:glycosyltransferase involved in cell wall biosynthesis
LRIALVSEVFLPKIDGVTNRISQTVQELRHRGHLVRILAPTGTVSEHAGARVVQVPSLPFGPYPGLRAALPDPRIVWHLLRFRPDLVHAVGPACLGVWAMLAARALRIPCVASYHTSLSRYADEHGLGGVSGVIWPLLRAIHNLADHNLAPSSHTKAELESRGIPDVGIWRGGVDAARFHPRRRSVAMRERLSQGDVRSMLALYVGRLSPEKNLETLREVLHGIPRLRLALVGDGPARPMLERYFRGHRVTFTGLLRGEALASAYASADLFLMPSETETLGFVVLEAMASGCPVIAARAGGITDLIEHERTGLLYDPAKPGALVEAPRRLLEDRALRSRCALQARRFAEEATWERETRALLAHYRVAIAAARGVPAPRARQAVRSRHAH